MFKKRLISWLVACLVVQGLDGQLSTDRYSFFEPADTFNQTRYYGALGFTTGLYTGLSISLYNTWYSKFEREGFHFFDDRGEWNDVDKAGHLYSSYFQGVFGYKVARWTGLSESESILYGAISGAIFQTSIEIMDGFSSKWGFSVADFGANLAGVGLFALQQKGWKEQRILIKQSAIPAFPEDIIIRSQDRSISTNLRSRAAELFGSSLAERYLKDYNNQTYWASFNISSFLPSSKLPSWLNLAFGYGSENLYGGFENKWQEGGANFELSSGAFPRYRQYYLSLDVDLSRIKTNSPFLKTLLTLLNVFKTPAPTLELTSHGEIQWHWVFF